VNRQLQRVRGTLYLRDTKTETSEATLPMPDICTTALQLRKSAQTTAAPLAGPAWQDFKLIFTTRYGTPIEPRNFNRYFHARCEKAGERRIRVHDARHTCATFADLDVRPRVAMQILRHAQIADTMEIYTEVSSPATREALRAAQRQPGMTLTGEVVVAESSLSEPACANPLFCSVRGTTGRFGPGRMNPARTLPWCVTGRDHLFVDVVGDDHVGVARAARHISVTEILNASERRFAVAFRSPVVVVLVPAKDLNRSACHQGSLCAGAATAVLRCCTGLQAAWVGCRGPRVCWGE